MIEQTIGEFKRILRFKPGHCWVRETPSRDFGNGSVSMWFILVGPKGAVQWHIGTDWMPEAARNDVARRVAIHGLSRRPEQDYQKPHGWDLGYHSPTPMYEGHEPTHHKCDLLDGPCYYDGSGLAADDLIEGFLNGGDEWVWNRLEAYYRHHFHDAAYPDFTPIIEPHPDDRPAVS